MFEFPGPLLPEGFRGIESELEDGGMRRRRTEVHLGSGAASGNRVPVILGRREAEVAALTQEQVDLVRGCEECEAEQVLLDIRGVLWRGASNVPQSKKI